MLPTFYTRLVIFGQIFANFIIRVSNNIPFYQTFLINYITKVETYYSRYRCTTSPNVSYFLINATPTRSPRIGTGAEG